MQMLTTWALILLVLLFWAVGAYNRLVRLRGAVVQTFAALDTLLLQHSGWLAGNPGMPDTDGESVLEAANTQFGASLAVARASPLDAAAVQALAAGQQVLFDAWHSASAQQPDEDVRAELRLQHEALRAQMALAGQQFNGAVAHYNQAVAQFPALLLAWLFGFKKASPL